MNSSRVLSLASQSLLVLCATIPASPQLRAQSTLLAKQIREIADRPEYRHSSFGIEVYSLDDNKVVFSRDADKLFTPASTTKLLTMGSAMESLGKDFRFHTFIYRTGPIDSDGTLKGDLILVASGDPDLSGRIQPDGTLAFENEDHSYDGSPDTKAVPGDPLFVIRELASQVVSHGVKKIDGRVLVDISLFPQGTRELGTGVVISPICVNDNIVDVTAVPGKNAGDDVILNVSPRTSYVTFVNQAKTAAADSKPSITWQSDIINPDRKSVV